MSMQVPVSALKVARVLYEDDSFMTIEVIKDENRKLEVHEADRFLSLLFLRSEGDGHAVIFTPWDGGTPDD